MKKESKVREQELGALSATGLPGQEKRPRADIDILVSASQAAGVLLEVVPGILVEVWHLEEEAGLRTSPGTFLPASKEMAKHVEDRGSIQDHSEDHSERLGAYRG